MIYVFGDSHVNFFTYSSPGNYHGSYNEFQSYSIGPGTAHQFYEKRYSIVISKLETLDINKDDFVMLIAGEIDCRIHIPRLHILNNIPIADSIRRTIDRFLMCHKDLIDKGYNCIIWGHQPSLPLLNHKQSNSFVYGDEQLRNNINRIWCDRLESECNKLNIPFISIFDILINDDNTAKSEFFIDDCHINSQMLWPLVYDMFKNRGLINASD